jgi:hypothetical protein
MHQVFTRILLGDFLEANSGGTHGSTDCNAAAVVWVADSWLDLFLWLQMWGVENPKVFGFYL